ncbi:hypothetical protein [Sorangium sp. So ce381]
MAELEIEFQVREGSAAGVEAAATGLTAATSLRRTERSPGRGRRRR